MIPPPGLSRDSVGIKRPTAAVDAEGNDISTLTTVLTTRGTWGTPRSADRRVAEQAGQVLDAVVAMATADVRPGDVMTVKAADWEVLSVTDVRTHQRVFLRRVVA